MEYLTDITDSLNNINEDNIEYLNLFEYPHLFYGTLNFSNEKLNLCKFPQETQEEMVEYGEGAVSEMKHLNSSACGVRLRFKTNSSRIIFKVKLQRKYAYLKMVNWGSSGFDVYKIIDNKYYHRTIFAPTSGCDIFAEEIREEPNSELCIFLPNYNKIEELYIGLEKDSKIESVDYPLENRSPIIFYGNSVTQGASASRSGNSFVNYVSKMLNRDVINFSCSSCCLGNESMANLIGKLNCHAIVIDYTRNAHNTKMFKSTHEKFYKQIRAFHPNTKIVLMTSESYNHWFDYYDFDEIVKETYTNAIERGENVELLHQKDLFEEDEYDLIAIDASHYTDYGMYKVAEKICELIEK